MTNRGLKVVIVVETALLGLAALGVFAYLNDQYEQSQEVLAEETAVAQAREFFVAMLTATPPTRTPTMIPSRSRTPTPEPSVTATETGTPTITLTPSPSPEPSSSPAPRPTHTSGPSPTLGPTRTPGIARGIPSGPVRNVSQCGPLDSSGIYRLTTDLAISGDCITIQASNVILDCGGHAIKGTGFGGYGISVRRYGLLGVQSPSNVEIRNCRLSNFRYGIFADTGMGLNVHDNNSSDNYDDTDPKSRYGRFLGMTDGGGIRLENVSNSQVVRNTTTHQAIGIDIRSSSNITVRGNTSSGNSAWGINFQRTQNSLVTNNTTSDNVRMCTWGEGVIGEGCDAGGIAIQDGSSNNTISGNSVTGRNGNGIFIKAHAMPCGNNNAIISNTITSVMYNAVELGFCSGNKVNGNTIRGGLDGIWLGYAHDTEIKNNTIANMSNHGIISSNSRNNMVSGNQIVSSNEGLYFFSEKVDPKQFNWLPPGDYASHDNCLCSNRFEGNRTAAVHLRDSTANLITNNTFQGNGRNIVIQGRGDGNNTSGNVGWQPPSMLGRLAAGLGSILW